LKQWCVLAGSAGVLVLILSLAGPAQTVYRTRVTDWLPNIAVPADKLANDNNQEHKTLQAQTTKPTATPTAKPIQTPSNSAYRLQIYSPTTSKLPATHSWTLQYQFKVPPLPRSPKWNYKVGTVYQWGDADFDGYGSTGAYKLSDYRFNQIVAELILGNVLEASDANYKPSWSQRSTWAIIAQ
jgi:hypothetical protein